MQKAETEASKRLTTEYGIDVNTIKETSELLHAMQEFVQYLGTNQYYSDAVNKKIFLITLDVDTALLRIQKLLLESTRFRETLIRAALKKKKTALDAKQVAAFRENHAALERQVEELHGRALALTEDIRSDYSKKL